MDNKLLPIGTVVLLKGGIKKLMITGFMSATNDDIEKVYDYCGCMYPEGVLTTSNTFLFNHNQIDKICFMGFVDKEEEVFKEKLNRLIESTNLQIQSETNMSEDIIM